MQRDVRSEQDLQRIMRVAMPVDVIRDMDALILGGIGGYRTRGEFILDAIQERILELSGVEESAGSPAEAPSSGAREATEPLVMASRLSAPRLHADVTTALTEVRHGYVVSDDVAVDRPEGKPLFGMHNRDYPSLWTLRQLAELAEEGPVRADEFYASVIAAASEFGRLLMRLEQQSGVKCTAVFPTNPAKRKPAEAAFRMFAIGEYRQLDDDGLVSSGPLFEWGVARVVSDSGTFAVGLTDIGWELLDQCTGLSVDEPHPESIARSFLRHLAVNAREDWRGFVQVIGSAAADGVTRAGLLEDFRTTWPDWTDNEISTNAAGYVARAREWGLLEPKQVQGRYQRTAFGHDLFTHEMKEFCNE